MMKPVHWIISFAIPLLASCATLRPAAGKAALADIDHVIVGVSDLDAGIREFERLSGVRAMVGGVHPGQGTRNALLSLGDGAYLELYAPNPAEPVDSPAVIELKALSRLKPLGWAVRAAGPHRVRAAMRGHGLALSSPEPGSRKRPDGVLLEWNTFGFKGFDHALAPFFIQWRDMSRHPSQTSPRGCRLVSLRLVDPQPTVLAGAVRPLTPRVLVEGGAESLMELKLACRRGEVVLR